MKEIVICPYNPEWKTLFKAEENILQTYFRDEYKSIIHIVSTSVERMDAKPIIDISIAVNELQEDSYYKDKLSDIGYTITNGSKFEKWILFYRNNGGQEYHLHLMHYESMRLFKQVLFKIYLEDNPKVADLYVRKKKAILILDDHIWYSMNKKPIVDEICTLAFLEITEHPNYWRERIQNVMGYVPHMEFFEMNDKVGIVQEMLRDKMDITTLSKYTGFSVEEINDLRKN